MAMLKPLHKHFIVQKLAMMQTPSQVVEQFKDEFGIKINRQQVALYQPGKVAAARLSTELRELFDTTRAAFLTQINDIPIANQAYRISTMQQLLNLAVQNKNTVQASALMEQAAKEVGGAYTNRKEITGAGGGPVQTVFTRLVREIVDPPEQQ